MNVVVEREFSLWKRNTLKNWDIFASPYRYYILRERPSAGSRSDNIMEDIPMNESGEGALLGLPESETDLDVCVKILEISEVENISALFVCLIKL